MIMSKLEEEIKYMIESKFSISLEENCIDSDLTGKEVGLDECDMVYLLGEIEKEYRIFIPTIMIESYQFNSIRHIGKSVEKLLENTNANQT